MKLVYDVYEGGRLFGTYQSLGRAKAAVARGMRGRMLGGTIVSRLPTFGVSAFREWPPRTTKRLRRPLFGIR